MVILLLSVLAAVAIPQFIDMRVDAKNAATKGAVGALRSAISIARAAIALKEEPSTSPKYPTTDEMWYGAQFNASHPVLSGTYIMAPNKSGVDNPGAQTYGNVPDNPWTRQWTWRNAIRNNNHGETKGQYCGDWDQNGWCYSETSGEIWANSDLNGGTNSASASNPTENWY